MRSYKLRYIHFLTGGGSSFYNIYFQYIVVDSADLNYPDKTNKT